MDGPPSHSSRSWSIYGRLEITEHYEILDRIGSGAYSDVYRGRRLSDGLVVALKEIHDYQSSFREIEALQTLRHAPNVVDLIDYFWQEDDDAVLVLEYLPTDLAAVIREGKQAGRLPSGEVKQWMLQILRGVDACHKNSVVHRDLKPSNLLISADGNLKLADFGQAKIIQGSRVINEDNFAQPELLDPIESHMRAFHEFVRPINEFEYFQEVEDVKAKCSNAIADEASVQDGETSCLATCSTGEIEDDPFKRSYSYESGTMTSCVGTRWFRSPELLYGSTNYGLEVDLWSLGCVFAELLSLQPLFPGSSDIDQIGKIIHVLGDFNEETWLGCSKLPDYYKIAFNKVECPIGLEAIFRDHSFSEVGVLKRLVVYDPAARATAAELLGDAYFKEEPLPVPLNDLNIPKSRGGQDERPSADWGEFMDDASDSDFEDFCGVVDVTNTDKGFSIKFS